MDFYFFTNFFFVVMVVASFFIILLAFFQASESIPYEEALRLRKERDMAIKDQTELTDRIQSLVGKENSDIN